MCEISVICIAYYMFAHVFCTPWMMRFRGSSLFSCEHVQKGIWGQIIWIPFNAHCKGELLLNLKIQNFNSLYLFLVLSSITKKGEIESASRPLVCFGGLIDTTIKGLTILLSIWAEIDYHICYICDEMYQCSRQNSYDKMNATTWSSMRMITSNEYCVNWDMCYWWRIHSYI